MLLDGFFDHIMENETRIQPCEKSPLRWLFPKEAYTVLFLCRNLRTVWALFGLLFFKLGSSQGQHSWTTEKGKPKGQRETEGSPDTSSASRRRWKG